MSKLIIASLKPVGFKNRPYFLGVRIWLNYRRQSVTCGIVPAERARAHSKPMGGPKGGVRKEAAYHIPKGVVEYIAGLKDPGVLFPHRYIRPVKMGKKSNPRINP